MSFLSGLSNIFHSIGHIFDSQDDDQQKKQQQQHNQSQPQQPAWHAPMAAPGTPQHQNQPNQPQQNTSQPGPQIIPNVLYQGGGQQYNGQHMPQTGSFDPNAPLFKANPNPNDPNLPFNQRVAEINAHANDAPQNTTDRAINTVADSVARSVTGVPQGIAQLYDMLTPGKGTNRVTKAINHSAEEIDQDQQKNGLQGRVGSDVYHGLQIAENVLPGAVGAVAKGADLVKAVPGVVKGIPEAVRAVPSTVSTIAHGGTELLQKAATATADAIKQPWESPMAAADAPKPSVAAGVKSANVNQERDAAAQIQATAPPPPEPLPEISPNQMNPHEQQALAQLNQDAKTKTLPPDQAAMRTALQQKQDAIQAANEPVAPSPAQPRRSANSPATGPQKVVSQTDSQASLAKSSAPSNPAQPELPPSPQGATAPLSKVSNSSSQSPLIDKSVAQTSDVGKTAPNAPNLRSQAEKDLATFGSKEDAANPARTKGDKLIGRTKEHDVFSNQELNDAAERYNATKSDDELVHDYVGDGTKKVAINSAADLAKAYSAVKRFGKMAAAGDERAKSAISDILDAAEEHVSKSGRTLNYAGSMYDSLPKEAKTAYLLKNVDKARNAAGLEPLTDAEKAAAEKTINDLLTKGEDFMQVAVEAQGKIEAARDAVKAGEKSTTSVKDLYKQDKIAQDNIRKAEAAQGELTDAYSKLAPEGTNIGNIGNKAGNFARSLMLTSVTGRASDIATTSANVLHMLTQHAAEAAIGKVANTARAVAGKEPGKYIDTLPSGQAFVHGGEQGAQKFAGQITGKNYVDDVQKMIKSNPELGKGQLRKATNPVVKFITSRSHAMAEAATNLSEGVKNTRLLQLAYQDGKKAGLTGDDLDIYAHSTALSPTKAMSAKGDELVDIANNMNDNPFTNGLETIAKGFDKIPVVGDTIRNLVSPFNRWVGGAAWNGVTDKNVVANVIKAGRAMAKGDSQEVVHQLAGLATNSVGAMGAGYALAQAGVLRTTNAEGYNDDGLYLHLGAHNIPVGFFGFFAPGIIMGAATHDAMNDKTPGKNVAQKVMDVATKSFDGMAKAYLHNTTIGGGNSLLRDTQNAIQGKNGVTWGDVGVNAAADATGNYIPGAAGDVNSAINTFNIGNLNPTHEAGLTKVTKGMNGEVDPRTGNPSTAKDVPRTAVNQLANRVPVLGQKVVPRNPGVAAQDPYSRVYRGDNESPEQQSTKNAVSVLPQDQQDKVMAQLRTTNGATKLEAEKAAQNAKSAPAKVKAQAVVDKMNFVDSHSGDKVNAAVEKVKQADDVGKFQKSGNTDEIKTIGGKTYAMVNGKATAYDTPQKAQQAIDLNNFKAGDAKMQKINGMVYQRGSDGKVSGMEQKDYDYKTATEGITSSKNSGDVTGYIKHSQDLLDNISWQLQHADLTDQARASAIQKAVQVQEEIAKTNKYGGFSKPKGVDTYASPQITGDTKGYTPHIQEMGAKYGVDINALMSVAAQEGLGGGVGDNGHAFGPFQMNDAGGVLKGKFKSSEEARKYAESPQGIEDAVKQIAAVAKGKTGADAIKAIVNEFERPADPEKEIANALALYNGGKQTVSPDGSSGVSSDAATAASDKAAKDAAALVKSNVIGSVHQMSAQNFTGLTPQKITAAAAIPTIQKMKAGDLIKARNISVSKVK